MSQEKKLLNCLMIGLNLNLSLSTEKKNGTRLKVLTPKQMLQRLPIALAQVKADNNSESLLNEIGQIVYQSKEITKKYIITELNQ